MNRPGGTRNGGQITPRLVGVLVLLAASLALSVPVNAASTPDVQSRYATGRITYGTASVGSTTLIVWKSGRATLSLGVKGLPYRKPANIWIYAGSCGHLGARILVVTAMTPATTQLVGTFLLRSDQKVVLTNALASGPIALIVGSKYRCATLPSSKPCRTAALMAPPTWRVLVLAYSSSAFTYRDATGASASFTSTMTDAEVATVQAGAAAMGPTVSSWSGGRANAAVTLVMPSHPLTSVEAAPMAWNYAPGAVVANADSVRADLATVAPAGAYDSVLIVWKSWNDQVDLPLPYAGLALGLDSGTNAQVASVQLPRTSWGDFWMRDVLIHEWLHGVVFFAQGTRGYAGPNPDTATNYGYTDVNNFEPFYADLMSGQIKLPDGTLTGLTTAVWRSGTPRSRVVAGCYMPFGTFLGF